MVPSDLMNFGTSPSLDNYDPVMLSHYSGLWGFLAAWRTLFVRFDEDGSGAISFDEYSKALVAFGYSLSPSFVNLMYRNYDRRGQNQMSFDIFVQSCISLKRMTDVFKNYDNDRDGYITLSFEEFLTGWFFDCLVSMFDCIYGLRHANSWSRNFTTAMI